MGGEVQRIPAVAERPQSVLPAKTGGGGVDELGIEPAQRRGGVAGLQLGLVDREAEVVVQHPVVGGQTLARVRLLPGDRRGDLTTAGVDDRQRIAEVVVAPVKSARLIQGGRDVARAGVGGGQRDAQRGFEPGVDRAPRRNQVRAAGEPRQIDRAAQADGGPDVVAGDVGAGELLVIVDRARRQQPQRVQGAGLRDPVHGGGDGGQLPAGERRVVSQPGVLVELPQGLADAVLLAGPADEEAVGLLPVAQKREVLRGRGVQADLVQRHGLDRGVADPVGLVLQAVDRLDPARRRQIPRLQDRQRTRVIDVVHARFGDLDAGHPALLGGPVGDQPPSRGRQADRVQGLIGGGGGGGRRERDLPGPGGALTAGQPPRLDLLGADRVRSGRGRGGDRRRLRAAHEQQAVTVDITALSPVAPGGVKRHAELQEVAIARAGEGSLIAVVAGDDAVEPDAGRSARVGDPERHARPQRRAALVGGGQRQVGDRLSGHGDGEHALGVDDALRGQRRPEERHRRGIQHAGRLRP